MQRPAETLSAAGAFAFLTLYLFDRVDDPTLLVAATIVVGHIPAAVTWFVNLARGRRDAGE